MLLVASPPVASDPAAAVWTSGHGPAPSDPDHAFAINQRGSGQAVSLGILCHVEGQANVVTPRMTMGASAKDGRGLFGKADQVFRGRVGYAGGQWCYRLPSPFGSAAQACRYAAGSSPDQRLKAI